MGVDACIFGKKCGHYYAYLREGVWTLIRVSMGRNMDIDTHIPEKAPMTFAAEGALKEYTT